MGEPTKTWWEAEAEGRAPKATGVCLYPQCKAPAQVRTADYNCPNGLLELCDEHWNDMQRSHAEQRREPCFFCGRGPG